MSTAATFDRKRFGAVALFAVLLLAGLIWIGWASLAVSTIGEQLTQQEAQLDALATRTRSLTAGVGGEGNAQIAVYFPGDTQAIAAAAVQRTVDEIVEKAGGRVVESQILPVQPDEETANRIDLRASFEADIDALQKALYDIETHLPMMMVKSMSVRSFVQAGRRDADEKNPILQVALVVSGFWTAEQP
ncbi:type II secretion system protein GspM [Microbaculum sp. FT89]|uniref:type II secretion system protein GspM n=1 Tax=Microbaculum sp. FT89 TaxID=3447298 RepID=UPI003F530C4F